MAIYLMRHPETNATSGICLGQTDIPLSDAGKESIPMLVTKALELKPDAIVSSDLSRCRSLAIALYAAGVPIWTQDPVWREVDFGRWEGRAWDHIYKTENATYEDWVANCNTAKAPEGESFEDLHRRVWFGLDQLSAAGLGNVIVVTHAGVIRALLKGANADAFELKVPFGSIHEAPETD